MSNSKNKNCKVWRYRRLFGFFQRKKPPLIDLNYSYQYMMRFPRLPITVPPLVPTLMSYRWNDDDEYQTSPNKVLRNSQPHPVRRRFSKRYSDLVVPSSNRIYLPRKDSIKHRSYKRKSNGHPPHPDPQPNNRSSLPKTKKIEQSNNNHRSAEKTKRDSSTTNAVDLLAHRMQAAMSAELMHSLDRNFILNEKKSSVNRTQSLHFSVQPIDEWWRQSPGHHLIPRVKQCFDEKQDSEVLHEPAPDYDEPEEEEEEEDIVVRSIENIELTEEPSIDYDEPNLTPTDELDQISSIPDDLGVSSSVQVPQITLTPTSENSLDYQTIYPPSPPPLPPILTESNRITFRCRTIADQITPDHKLISKSMPIDEQSSPIPSAKSLLTSQPTRFNLTKEILAKTNLRKVSQPISRSFSTYGSISQLNEPQTQSTTILHKKSSLIEEQPSDNLSSSATTSIVIENEYEHKKSSKVYNDYKRRTSSINISASRQSAIIHPIHTHIGFRSSTSSSSTNDKLNDMNICVINQLNQHLTTRFQKQQESPSKTIVENKSSIYDEPEHVHLSSIPPPPPPLPIGGFRNISTQPNRSQRTSVMTLTRDVNSTGTSTTSSKLSDTRILRELRTNPLFTKAKQHLEIESEQINTSKPPCVRSEQVNKKIHSELELIFQKRTQRNP